MLCVLMLMTMRAADRRCLAIAAAAAADRSSSSESIIAPRLGQIYRAGRRTIRP